MICFAYLHFCFVGKHPTAQGMKTNLEVGYQIQYSVLPLSQNILNLVPCKFVGYLYTK